MLNGDLEARLKEALERAADGLDVADVTRRQLERHYRPPGSRRWAILGAALAVLLGTGLGIGLTWSSGAPAPGHTHARTLSLRLVDEQVRLVAGSSLSAVADVVAISCSDANHCEAVGTAASGGAGVAATTSDGGAEWTDQELPPNVRSLTGLSCVSANDCVVVGARSDGSALLLTTANGGTSWAVQTLPGSVQTLRSVACASAGTCWAVGSEGKSAALLHGSLDGAWHETTAPAGATALTAIGCAPGSAGTGCLAVGWSGTTPVALETDGGSLWSALSTPAGTTALAGAACSDPAPSCTTLAQIGTAWYETSWYLTRPSTPVSPAGHQPPGLIVSPGTVIAGVGFCASSAGPPCTPHDRATVSTVMRVIDGLTSAGGPTPTPDETLTSAYVFGSTAAPQLSPVWYMGEGRQGLEAYLVLTPAERLGTVPVGGAGPATGG